MIYLCYLLISLAWFSWATMLHLAEPSLPLLAGLTLTALLPDLLAGLGLRLGFFAAERLSHTLWVAALVGASYWLLPPPLGLLLLGAFAGHLVVDMLTDERGLPLFWPLSNQHFYLATLTDFGGQVALAVLLGLLTLLPHFHLGRGNVVQNVAAAARPLLPTPTPATLTIRVLHVHDLEAEILVQPGDAVEQGDLLADLATYRRYLPPLNPPRPGGGDAAETSRLASGGRSSPRCRLAGKPTANPRRPPPPRPSTPSTSPAPRPISTWPRLKPPPSLLHPIQPPSPPSVSAPKTFTANSGATRSPAIWPRRPKWPGK